MNTVQMNRKDLISALEENLKVHLENYEEALQGWQRDYTTQLEEEYRNVTGPNWDGEGPWRMQDPRPISYENDYRNMISMLTSDIRDVIELSHYDYQRYVLDQWEWKDNFLLSNSKYMK